jgi:hypothetical protein
MDSTGTGERPMVDSCEHGMNPRTQGINKAEHLL